LICFPVPLIILIPSCLCSGQFRHLIDLT
jgi:hypothetical protein